MKTAGLGLVALGALVMSSCAAMPPATPSTRTGRSQLFTMLADGMEQRILQTREDAISPAWSPPPE